MAKRLTQHLDSAYLQALNRLNGKDARQKIVVYVESFDDILFWRTLLQPLETERYYFEVMLPSRTSLCKGKKVALANRLGPYMIACVDADYDYVMQGATETSRVVCTSPYVFHTYAYAIESFQCYAPALNQACVMATLNDRRVFDFETFLSQYSEIIWPLFVWNVWAYRHGVHTQFSMLHMYHIVALDNPDLYHPDRTLHALRRRVNAKIARLQSQFPRGKSTYAPLRDELLSLGLTPQTTYLYMRGHDLWDGVVGPMLTTICEALRREREKEIRLLAEHQVQMQNELSAYQHATASIEEMVRKYSAYTNAPLYRAIQQNIQQFLSKHFSEQQQNDAAEKGENIDQQTL